MVYEKSILELQPIGRRSAQECERVRWRLLPGMAENVVSLNHGALARDPAAHARRRGTVRVSGRERVLIRQHRSVSLLNDMRQLVCQESLPSPGVRCELAESEHDIPTQCVRPGMHRSSGLARLIVRMNTHGAEISFKPRFETGANGRSQ
jgi:hypothetical protein